MEYISIKCTNLLRLEEQYTPSTPYRLFTLTSLFHFLTFSFSSELYIISNIGANNSPSNANAATEYWLSDFFVLLTKSDEAVAATDAAAIATAMAVSLSTRSEIFKVNRCL